MHDRDRTPYPFFDSVEFWTIVAKTLPLLLGSLGLIAKAGFSVEAVILILIVITNGTLEAKKELYGTPNLYLNGVKGQDKESVIRAIACESAKEIAANEIGQTVSSVLQERATEELVNFASEKVRFPPFKRVIGGLFK